MMIIKRCVTVLTLLASCAALSYAQADGGIGGHAPARSYAATSTNFTVPGASCAGATPGSDVALDCAEFGPPGAVQEVFAFYNQTGVAFNSLTVNLQFTAANYGAPVGCPESFIAPTFTSANCETPGTVTVPSSGPTPGLVTLTFTQGLNGIGISCYDPNPASGPDAPIAGANQACLNNSANNFATDLSTLGKAQLPYIDNLNPTNTQTAGPCTIPPNNPNGVPLNDYLPWLVCGQNSWVLGIGVSDMNGNGGSFVGDSPVISAEVFANPEPPTLLLVGAAMIAMSLFFMKKRAAA